MVKKRTARSDRAAERPSSFFLIVLAIALIALAWIVWVIINEGVEPPAETEEARVETTAVVAASGTPALAGRAPA